MPEQSFTGFLAYSFYISNLNTYRCPSTTKCGRRKVPKGNKSRFQVPSLDELTNFAEKPR
jgi:hypothetical protein